jgi:hypothetical protein
MTRQNAPVRRPEIMFGALASPIEQQLAAQGLKLENENQVARFQKTMDSLACLKIHGMITDSEAARVRDRIGKAVFARVVEIEVSP